MAKPSTSVDNANNTKCGGVDDDCDIIQQGSSIAPSEIIFVQNQNETVEITDANTNTKAPSYRYVIDPSGNLLMLQEVDSDENKRQQKIGKRTDSVNVNAASEDKVLIDNVDNNSHSAATGPGQVMTLVKVLETGEYVLETVNPGEIVGGEITKKGRDAETTTGKCSTSRTLPVSGNIIHKQNRKANAVAQISSTKKKLTKWTSQMITDLLNCISKHESKFQEASKVWMVWNRIASDMKALGHSKHNRDECSKKWNNLYRTWRLVNRRPLERRKTWKYYELVSKILKSFSVEHEGVEHNSNKRLEELTRALLFLTKSHQDAVRRAEKEFESKVRKLNMERNEILCDIKKILQAKKVMR